MHLKKIEISEPEPKTGDAHWRGRLIELRQGKRAAAERAGWNRRTVL